MVKSREHEEMTIGLDQLRFGLKLLGRQFTMCTASLESYMNPACLMQKTSRKVLLETDDTVMRNIPILLIKFLLWGFIHGGEDKNFTANINFF